MKPSAVTVVGPLFWMTTVVLGGAQTTVEVKLAWLLAGLRSVSAAATLTVFVKGPHGASLATLKVNLNVATALRGKLGILHRKVLPVILQLNVSGGGRHP